MFTRYKNQLNNRTFETGLGFVFVRAEFRRRGGIKIAIVQISRDLAKVGSKVNKASPL